MTRESDIRSADFSFTETRVNPASEVDVFRPDGIDGLEIQVTLMRHPSTCDLIADSVRLTDQEGKPLHVTGEHGQALNADEIEVLIWEIIEDDVQRSLEYSYGREPSRLADGELAPAGAILVTPEDEMAFEI
ncbi:hypothetical protein [Leisingera caerulea]|uniref:hypothetical protein n=1 Tax=Leisingera caerulea TaxID=506591 RepID=UPI00040B051F|nr:hypothetical protein [Leisingera caerulea]